MKIFNFKFTLILIICITVSNMAYAQVNSTGGFPFVSSINVSPNPITLNTILDTEATLSAPSAMGLCELRINNVLAGTGFYKGNNLQTCYPVTILPSEYSGFMITKVGSYPISWTFTPDGCNQAICKSVIEDTLQVVLNASSSSSSSGSFPFISSITFPQAPITLNTAFNTEAILNAPGAKGICQVSINGIMLGSSFYNGNFTQGCFTATVNPPFSSFKITQPGNYPISWTFTPQGCNNASCISKIEDTLQIVSTSTNPNPNNNPLNTGSVLECDFDPLHTRITENLKSFTIEGSESTEPEFSEDDDNDLTLKDKAEIESFNNLDNLVESITNLQNIQLQIKRYSTNVSSKISSAIELAISALNSSQDECAEKIDLALDALDEAASDLEKSSCEEDSCSVKDDLVSNLEEIIDKFDELITTNNNIDETLGICSAADKISQIEELTGTITRTPQTILSNPVPNQFIIEFVDSEENPSSAAEELALKYGLEILYIYDEVFAGALAIVPEETVEELANDSLVKTINQDYTGTTTDIKTNNYVHYQTSPSPPQEIPSGIDWLDAELNPNEGNLCKTTVAVLDTGIDLDHEDLEANIDKNLSTDVTQENTSGDDIDGHGTFVAGIIGAIDNNVGVIGVGSLIELISVKVCEGTRAQKNINCSVGNTVAGLNHVARNSGTIEVANLSLINYCNEKPKKPKFPRKLSARRLKRYLKEFRRFIKNYNSWKKCISTQNVERKAVKKVTDNGIVVVVAAGNDLRDVSNSNAVPAKFSTVFTVSALDDGDGVRGGDSWAIYGPHPVDGHLQGSNYGQEIDIIAPGGKNIKSTKVGGDYETPFAGGTSAASPHVAGTVALYISKNGRPRNGDARRLNYLRDAISEPRVKLPDEPSPHTKLEPACYANGPEVRP